MTKRCYLCGQTYSTTPSALGAPEDRRHLRECPLRHVWLPEDPVVDPSDEEPGQVHEIELAS